MRLQILVGLLEIGVELLFSDSAYYAASGTVTTIRCAPICNEKKDAVRIPVHKAWDRHVRVFAARVRHFDRRSICFFEARDYLATNRAIGILGVDQVKKVGGDRKRELVAGQQDAGAFFAGKGDLPLELAQVGDSVFKLPFPVVPVFRSDIGPETRREGKEPLVGGLG